MEINSPKLWQDKLPVKGLDAHKYDHGHAVIYGAPALTGATRLAAAACARMGAGLVSVLCGSDVAAVYKAALPAHIMVRDDLDWWDDRVSARLYGSGGLAVTPDFDRDVPTVLDADALKPEVLPKRLSSSYVLTPHEGEFARVFPDVDGTREERAVEAARIINAHVVLKGSRTVIADPDGRLVINENAPPTLATAGSGDVLAGMIAGLLAQGMPAFEASAAAAWLHGAAAEAFGAGLVASDLPNMLPRVLGGLIG